MKSSFEYRAYQIANENGLYIGRSMDEETFALGSTSVLRVMRAIDTLWHGLETNRSPAWLTQDAYINLDHPSLDEQFQTAGTAEQSGQFTFETSPSEVDPPKWRSLLFVLAAIAVAAPLSFFMHQVLVTSEPAIILTLAVTAVALTYGTNPAVLLTLFSMLFYNLCIVPPALAFSVPTSHEIVYAAINVGISVAIPWLFGTRQKWQDDESTRIELA
jgi:hypothetical protein